MVALLGMASSVIPSVNRLVIANIQIQEAMVAFDRMFEFTSMEKEKDEGSLYFPTSGVEIQNLSFRFPGRKQILKDVSLNFKNGEKVALLGVSGEGKSTWVIWGGRCSADRASYFWMKLLQHWIGKQRIL